MRWQDVIGFAGLSLVVLGTLFMFPSSLDGMHWRYLLAGSVLWVVGFVSVIGWLLWRWSIAHPAPQESSFSSETKPDSDAKSRGQLAA